MDNCDYSTATFYRHFKDKYDLIAWDYAHKAEEIMAQLSGNNTLWKQTLMDWAAYFQTEKEYLANLFLHTSGHDSFIQYMAEIHYRAFTKHLLASSRQNDLDEKISLLARAYCLGTVCLSCEWILGKYSVTPEELAEIYEKAARFLTMRNGAPGHTYGNSIVIAEDGGLFYMFHGDISYTDEAIYADKLSIVYDHIHMTRSTQNTMDEYRDTLFLPGKYDMIC